MSKNEIDDESAQLHSAMTKYFLNHLQGDKPIKASVLDAARRFLKDNGITQKTLEQNRDEQHFESTECELPFQDLE